ncbi:hypothetical protein VKT23_001461 [Stygiomarasmius scandens]|uniref:Uncharacterized protein n=1 Tax=Marasmiellus scandens TaxID=2682957 RepID=A0ABR1K585_9AGAR
MDLDEYQTDRVDGAKDFGPAVSVIAQQVPQLRAMTIEGPCTELFLSLQRLGRLRDLTLSALSQDFMGSSLLKSMSSLPELERLEIFVYDELPKSGVSLAHVDVSEGFCHLTHLDIRTSALGLSRLLDGVPPNQLSSLAWGLTESEDEIILVETAHSQIPDVFSKLATKQRNTLSSLRATWHLFEYVFIEDENKDAIHRWRGVFEVLFGLSGLEKLVYHFPLHFSDNLLQHVANAWPKMVDMRFRRFMEGSVSPSSLSHFARNCPHLRTLFVPLKAGNSDIPPDVSGNETSHPLNTLFVGYGNKPQNPQTLAKYLSQMFPFVNIDGSILEGNNKWKTVQRMLETSRKEGRKELLTGQGPMGDNSTPVV